MKFGFLKHYKKIRIEGTNLSGIINKCISSRITLRNLRWKNDIEYTAEMQEDDYDRFRKLAGYTYKTTVIREGGAVPLFRSMKSNILSVVGAFLLGALIFYQSLFIAEVRVDGYRTLDESDIRRTLQEAGISEGVMKTHDYRRAKELLYAEYGNITWISIYEDGRCIKVKISEGNVHGETLPADTKPVNIVAAKSGIIESIRPLQGHAKAEKGDYVNKGDVLISGVHKYKSTDYSKGDKEFTLYSHAKGQAVAKVPVSITYYFEKNRRIKEPTGNYFHGLYVKAGNLTFDSTRGWGGYEASLRQEKDIVKTTRFLPLSIKMITVREVKLEDIPCDMKQIRKVSEAAVRQFEKDNFGREEGILERTFEYNEEKNLIRAAVMLETLENIGAEKEIKIKKAKKTGQGG